jgi:WD40 repeat protein
MLKFFDLQKGGYVKKNEVQTNHDGFARCIRIVDERDLLISPLGMTDISVYDLKHSTEEYIYKLSFPDEDTGHLLCLKDLTISGKIYLISGYESGHIILWDLNESKLIHQIKINVPVCSVDYDEGLNRGVVASSMHSKIFVFNIDKATLELSYREYETVTLLSNDALKVSGLSTLKIRPDKKCLVTGSCDGVINIFSWKSLRKLVLLKNHRSEITEIAFSNGIIDNFKSNITAVASMDCVSLWSIYYK